MPRYSYRYFLLFALFLSLNALPQTLGASETAQDTDQIYARQIQLLGRQAALGHRLVRNICFVQSGIDTAQNRRELETTRDEIAATLQGLVNGDESRGIPAISNGNIRTQMGSVEMVWKGLDKKITAFLSDEGLSDKDVLKLGFKAGSLEKLLRNVTQSLELKTSVDSSPEQLERNRVIATASSQNRLLQQAGQSACFIHLAAADQAGPHIENLTGHIAAFDRNSFDLTFVQPTRAVIAVSEELELANLTAWQDWNGIEPLLSSVAETRDEDEMRRRLIELSLGIAYLDRELDDTLAIFMAL
ncbi:type IV pili methyl-accepting chemotaxis transducer N-terminal domain-containing protein [Celeribacter neptunius]|uniref:Type IV pili methyl-accepting chemotaxis transducer N-term n=1 Tax=Celeribacter neptunius TaxID=588602 RepID=A0A1I3VI30_9RHOB|nr:type IV pili methyl-accepting chemotaxis transducer N-terminal domain-containing protein [Celeribacter neptunius]SFJ95074.1 Type IV pili methyl-accepting chemotaxis transducer N-term [Celeribacter neptunius]